MIRRMELNDLKWVKEQRNRPECRMWFRQPTLLTDQDQETWFKGNSSIPFVILDPEGDKIGVCHLSHIDNIARKCEFSIMVIPEARGKGYSHKALWELLDHAFNDLNMFQVYSDVFTNNPALEMYLRWGFKSYGLLPQWYWKDGRYIDSVIISITKEDYVKE